jgi:hypothetical protein
MNRRHFLMSSAGVLAAARHATPSPNDTVRVACVGLRGRGKDHLKEYGRIANVEIAALCDIDENVLNEAAGKMAKRPATYSDLRKLLEDKSIDVVSIATPNHSHTLQTIWSCQAGKDVYVEKPCAHNMYEAKQIVAAARKYNRLVQQGSQSRSSPALQEACWVTSTWHAVCATNGATPSAIRRLSRYHRAWITICGWAPRRSTRSARIGFITTGTGSGTMAMAIWGTRAFMSWTSRAGAWE